MNSGLSSRKLARRGQTMVVKSQNTKAGARKKTTRREQILERCTPFSRKLPKPFLFAQEGKFKELEELLCPKGVTLPSSELAKIISIHHSDGTTILHHAVVGGSLDVVKLLIKCKVKLSTTDIEDLTPAHFALFLRKFEILELLLTSGAPTMKKPGTLVGSVFDEAVLANDRQVLRRVIKFSSLRITCVPDQKRGLTVIHNTAQLGKKVSLAYLLVHNRFKKHINDQTKHQRSTAAHLAASSNRRGCLLTLIKHGADVNIQDTRGFTALHCAVHKTRHRVVKALIESQKVNIDALDKHGRTALHLAVERKSLADIQLLLDANASLDIQTKTEGWTPIHQAITQAKPLEITNLLLDRLLKAKKTNILNLVDKEGRSCMTLAAEAGNTQLCTMFEKSGADPAPLYERKSLQKFRESFHTQDRQPADLDFVGFVPSHHLYEKLVRVASLPPTEPIRDHKRAIEKYLNTISEILKSEQSSKQISHSTFQKISPYLKKIKKKIVKHGLPNDMRARLWKLLLVDLAYRTENERQILSRSYSVKTDESTLTTPKGKHPKPDKKIFKETMSVTGEEFNLGSKTPIRGKKYDDKSLTYKALLEVELPLADSHQMHIDIERTLRCHSLFEDRYGEAQCKLFRILHAFVLFDSKTVNQFSGYAQGMSLLAAILLLYIQDEEETWVAMLTLFSVYSMDVVFRNKFTDLILLCQRWEHLLQIYFPEVKDKFETAPLPSMTYIPNWFMPIFFSIVPFPMMLRIWDLFLMDGFPILFSFSLSFIDLNLDKIMSETADGGTLTNLLKYDPGAQSDTEEKLISLAYTKYSLTDFKTVEDSDKKSKGQPK